MSNKLLGTTRCEKMIGVFNRKVQKIASEVDISENDFQRWLDENNLRSIYESYEKDVKKYNDLAEELQNKYRIIHEATFGDDNRSFCGMRDFTTLRRSLENNLRQKLMAERRAKLFGLVDEFAEKIWLLGSGDELKELMNGFDERLKETLKEINM